MANRAVNRSGNVQGGRPLVNAKRRVAVVAVIACVLAAVAASCGGSSGSSASGPQTSESIRGQTITVLVPYKIPQSVIDSFTNATGVKVNYVVTGWDQTHNKLVVANTAQTYVADVAEFDWSFTGQFAGAKWVEPLDNMLPAPLLADLKSTDAAFMSGGKTYAACFSNDFRISMYNKKMLASAGISEFPKTLDELGQAAVKLKAAGVQYPISIPMAATEGGVTPWYLLTLAHGGQLFDSSFKPAFTDPGSAGYKALQWEVDAVKNGWVSPGAVSLDDNTAFDKFTAGQTAIVLATGPGNLATANDPTQSSIAGQAEAALVPGVDGPGASFGLPEGLSIPVTARHKAAAAAFIEWWMKPENAIKIYTQEGNLPCGASVIQQLASSGQLLGGDVLNQELKLVKPLFPQGAPIWYSKFSSDAQGLINAAVKGDISVGDALSQLEQKAVQDAQQ
jgi:multiple sugar transport system substrate-binding protein